MLLERWGHRSTDRFVMDHAFVPSPGAQGFMCSNPPVLCCAALRASLEVFDEAGGVQALRGKALKLTALLEALLDQLPKDEPRLAGAITIFTPRDPEQRGCQLSLSFDSVPGGVAPVFQKLEAAGVICDVRKPVVMRVAPTPLYNSYVEVFDFVQLLKGVLLDILTEAAAKSAE
jgi:kynureninase